MFGKKSESKSEALATSGLGMTVRDKITGFSGVVTGKSEYLTGCRQFLVQSTQAKEGEFPSSVWLDEGRLLITDNSVAFQQPATAPNGPDREAPKK